MKGQSKAQHETEQSLEIWVIGSFFLNNLLEACKVFTVRTLKRGGLFCYTVVYCSEFQVLASWSLPLSSLPGLLNFNVEKESCGIAARNNTLSHH